jgi:hypothetical protein
VRNLTIETYYISLIRFRKVYLQRAIISSASKQFEVKEHNMNGKIYLDYAATTPVDERVLQAMMPYFTGTFGNPSSVHFFGQQAEAAVEEARQTVADCLNASPDEIVFTGCGSESDNLALRGAAFVQRERRGANHILISPVEHHAVSHTAHELASHHGFEVEMLPVDAYGRVDPADVQARLRPETAIVSVIYANNEIGTVNPYRRYRGSMSREGDTVSHGCSSGGGAPGDGCAVRWRRSAGDWCAQVLWTEGRGCAVPPGWDGIDPRSERRRSGRRPAGRHP